MHLEIEGLRGTKRKIFDDFVDAQNGKHIKMSSSPIMRPSSSNSLISPAGRQSPNFFNVAKKRPRTYSNSSVSSTASFNQLGSSKVMIDPGSSPKRTKIGVNFAVPYPQEDFRIITDKVSNIAVEQTSSSPVYMIMDGTQNKQLLNLSAAQEEFNNMNLGNKFTMPKPPQ